MVDWGVFRLRGLFNRKTVKARPVEDGKFAIEERTTTDKLRKTSKLKTSELEGTTCVQQSVLPREEFERHYIPVDAVAKKMMA